MAERVFVNWSGGKDCALALHYLVRNAAYEVAGLLTTISEEKLQVVMHGIPRALIEAQASALGLPLYPVLLPTEPDNTVYEARMSATLTALKALGIHTSAFGDLFLEDVRAYREQALARIGMRALFPLWARDSGSLAAEFVALGYRAVVVCVDTDQLSEDFVGRPYDTAFLANLPPQIDPCGENGEFHTFVYAGPIFQTPIRFEIGPNDHTTRFARCELIPG